MVYLLILKYLSSSANYSFKNIFAKSKYLTKIFLSTFSTLSKVIWAFYTKYIVIFIFNLREIRYNIKILTFLSSTGLMKSFLLMISTCQLVGKALVIL